MPRRSERSDDKRPGLALLLALLLLSSLADTVGAQRGGWKSSRTRYREYRRHVERQHRRSAEAWQRKMEERGPHFTVNDASSPHPGLSLWKDGKRTPKTFAQLYELPRSERMGHKGSTASGGINTPPELPYKLYVTPENFTASGTPKFVVPVGMRMRIDLGYQTLAVEPLSGGGSIRGPPSHRYGVRIGRRLFVPIRRAAEAPEISRSLKGLSLPKRFGILPLEQVSAAAEATIRGDQRLKRRMLEAPRALTGESIKESLSTVEGQFLVVVAHVVEGEIRRRDDPEARMTIKELEEIASDRGIAITVLGCSTAKTEEKGFTADVMDHKVYRSLARARNAKNIFEFWETIAADNAPVLVDPKAWEARKLTLSGEATTMVSERIKGTVVEIDLRLRLYVSADYSRRAYPRRVPWTATDEAKTEPALWPCCALPFIIIAIWSGIAALRGTRRSK